MIPVTPDYLRVERYRWMVNYYLGRTPPHRVLRPVVRSYSDTRSISDRSYGRQHRGGSAKHRRTPIVDPPSAREKRPRLTRNPQVARRARVESPELTGIPCMQAVEQMSKQGCKRAQKRGDSAQDLAGIGMTRDERPHMNFDEMERELKRMKARCVLDDCKRDACDAKTCECPPCRCSRCLERSWRMREGQ